MSTQILLNEYEIDKCLEWAILKVANDDAKNYSDRYFTPNSKELKFKYELLAIAAELSVAKWLGVPDWEYKINRFKNEPDIFPDWEVKHSPNREYLTIRPTDRDEDRAIFVTGENPFTIEGWLPVKYCKDDSYYFEGYEKPCWRVHRSELVKVLPNVPSA